MSEPAMRELVLNEVQQIPEDRLAEIYDVIHFFRVGVETTRVSGSNVMRFAGAWAEMSADEFEGFVSDISRRRVQAFTERRRDGNA